MPIEFNCPYCAMGYRLKDEFAGRPATCKNPECRKKITIPQPTTIPPSAAGRPGSPPAPGTNGTGPHPPARGKDDTPPPTPPVDAEAAALAALNETVKEEAAPADRTIPMVCRHCDHKWTEPLEKAGKNVLCPNPECRERQKVPDLKKDEFKEDWRQGRSNLPSLAKENFEKPKDVQDAGDVKIVSGGALKEAGAIDEGIEPRPLKQKIFFVFLALAFLSSSVFGVVYLLRSTKTGGEDKLMATALNDYEKNEDKPTPPEAALYSAILHTAAGEYTLRHDKADEKTLKDAFNFFAKARSEIQQAGKVDEARRPTTAERYALTGELAVATLVLGGNPEQIKSALRYGWLPEAPSGRVLRLNERPHSVYEELEKTLQLMQGADFDQKAVLARRLTRELMKRGQPDLASRLSLLLFSEPERDEGSALIAVEIWRADRNAEPPRRMAGDLKTQLEKGVGTRNPVPASAVTLWQLLAIEKVPNFAGSEPKSGAAASNDYQRFAYAGLWLLQGKADEALSLAQRPGGGTSLGQLRAYVLCAEWSPDNGPALGAAVGLAKSLAAKQDPSIQSLILRLTQLAAATGKPDLAKTFADFLLDEGQRVWAKGDAFRLGLNPEAKEPGDEAAVEVPDDPKKLRAGHAWARLWLARHNTRLTNKGAQEKAIRLWSANMRPFGLAGIALGLKDQ